MADVDLIPRDIADVLAKFDEEASQLVDAFVSTVASQQPPELIYHYTNDTGLRGILETGRLWFTDIFDLNDPSELTHGFSHVINTLKSKSADGPPESKRFAERFEGFGLGGGING